MASIVWRNGWAHAVIYVNGKPRWRSLKTRDPEEAQRRLMALQLEADKGEMSLDASTTFGEFLDIWMNLYAKPNLERLTYESYKRNIEKHIKPALGGKVMSKLRPTDFQAYYSDKLSEGLSPTTVRYQHRIMRQAMDHARKWGYVARNVVDDADPPRPVEYEYKTWTIEESRRFFEAIKDDPSYPIYAVAVFTGLRRGEILGLTWSDVDLENGLLAVRQTVVPAEGGLLIKPRPKTKRSQRLVKIGPALVYILKEHRHRLEVMIQKRLREGREWTDMDLVFPNRYGRPMDPHNLSGRHFPRMCAKAGVRRIRFHDLRHTHFSQLAEADVHTKVIQERAGHASASFTLDRYVHIRPEKQLSAALIAEELILGGVGAAWVERAGAALSAKSLISKSLANEEGPI